jgi:DNA-binding CsgD family transcriptional regulator
MKRMARNKYEEEDWERFERRFREIHPRFLQTLSASYPMLTPTEMRVCSLLKINLTSKEIAALLSTSVRTIEGHRQHIRRKLAIANGISLAMFLAGL